MLSSALFFSLMSVCVKRVGHRIPVQEVVLVRALVSVALSLLLLRQAGVAPWGNRRALLVLRGLLGSLALLAVFAALTRLPLASATLLQYTYPTLTALMAWLWLAERVRSRLWLAMALGWIGVLLVAQPGGARPLDALGVTVALGGALLTALAYVSVRALGSSEHPLVIVFYFPLISIPLTLPLVLLNPVLPSPVELGWMVAVGILTQLGQLGLTRGLVSLPAARATALSYAQVAFASLWGWWIFGESMTPLTLAGAALILTASLLSR
ncbi:MAG: DMT family transporter [Synechococcaceae cyanobacterium]|nr:DMT family transporter [Synechococcaceae cyanobacterium]